MLTAEKKKKKRKDSFAQGNFSDKISLEAFPVTISEVVVQEP